MQLAAPETARLAELEKVIEEGQNGFIDVAEALIEIKATKLYRAGFPTFENYCKDRWGFTERRASQLIEAAEVVGELSESGTSGTETLPKLTAVNERQIRAIAKAPKGKRKQAWREAVATAPKDTNGKPKVTARHVQKVVTNRREPSEPTDEIGNELPEKLRPAFGTREKFDRIENLLKQARTEINALAGQKGNDDPAPGGEELAANRVQLESAYRNLWSVVTFARPYALCPYPHGKESCAVCHGLGWVVKQAYERAPAEYRKGVA